VRPVLLIFPFDLLSHYLRCPQLADAVRDLYDVRFAHSATYVDHVAKAGFETFACDCFDASQVMACSQGFDFGWLNRTNIERIYSDQVRAIREAGATVVLGDTAPTLRMASEMTGARHLSVMNGYMSRHYALTRPIASAHPAARFADKLPPAIFDKMTQLGERAAFRQIHRPFRKLRRQLKLSRTRTYLDELEGDLNLICVALSMFPQKKLPDEYVSIGPFYHVGTEGESDLISGLDNERLTILVTTGSSGDPQKFGFLRAPGFSEFNIIVAGAPIPALTGDHVISEPFIDMESILPEVDVVVCHGGNGSLVQGLAHGIPVISVTSIFEQEWNARRAEDLSVGCWLREDVSEAEAERVVRTWIERKETGRLLEISRQIDLRETLRNFREVVMRL